MKGKTEMPDPEEKNIVKPSNKFIKIITIAKRARQLAEGSRPLLETHSPDPIENAWREVESDRIVVEIKKPKEFKLAPEPLAEETPPEKQKVRATKIIRPKKAKKTKKK